ncbi:isochorismatase domain-containing protein 2-like [Watersipora subatra]|uniref:isochorismatase domain-containing protein 2-like n=1 Tax=Watersipora subatra TaxID=2589382 RepID=UPI00355B1A29
MAVSAKLAKALPKNSALFLCDMQEKFRNMISYYPQILNTSARVLQAARVLDIPIIVTEQYPKALGKTCSELDVTDLKVFSKTNFNMLQPDVEEYFQTFKGVENVVICGIEGHVCVKSTVYELLKRGINTHVVVDAVSSRSMVDRLFALKAMSEAGAQLTTSESVILGFVEDASHPKFREVQKIIMESAQDSGLLDSRI